jgi:hypothetical protein
MPQPTTTCHVGGTTLFIVSHTAHTSPNSVDNVGDEPISSRFHGESMSLAIVIHVVGIHTIEKPRHIVHKTKFLCRI